VFVADAVGMQPARMLKRAGGLFSGRTKKASLGTNGVRVPGSTEAAL